jgi:hypothetical protein
MNYKKDNSVFTGEWKQGVKSGQGTLQKADGTTYKGKFAKDFMQG